MNKVPPEGTTIYKVHRINYGFFVFSGKVVYCGLEDIGMFRIKENEYGDELCRIGSDYVFLHKADAIKEALKRNAKLDTEHREGIKAIRKLNKELRKWSQ